MSNVNVKEIVNPAAVDKVSGEIREGEGEGDSPIGNKSDPKDIKHAKAISPKKEFKWKDFVSPPPWDSRSILRNKDKWNSYDWATSIPGVSSGAYRFAFGVLFVILIIVNPILQHKSGDGVTQLFLNTLGMNFAVSNPVMQLFLRTIGMNFSVSGKDPVAQLLSNL
ncbi:hypothetical protein MKX03_004119, partial [Papaver bracteatum]